MLFGEVCIMRLVRRLPCLALVCCAFFSIGLPEPALAEDVLLLSPQMGKTAIPVEVEVFIDETGELSIDQVASPENNSRFTKKQSRKILRITPKEKIWVRFPVVNKTSETINWVVVYQRYYPGEYEAYTVSESNITLLDSFGAKDDFATRAINYRLPSFPVSTPKKWRGHIYLSASLKNWSRAATFYLIPAFYEAWSAQAFGRYMVIDYIALGVFFGGILVMLFYNLFVYFRLGDAPYLFYCFYLLGSISIWLAGDGIFDQLLWGKYLDDSLLLRGLSSSFIVAFSALFTISFLNTKKLTPKIDLFLKFTFAYALFAFISPFIGIVEPILIFITGTAILPLITYPFIGWYIWRLGYTPARIYVLAWSLLAISIGIMVIMELSSVFGVNLIPESDFIPWVVKYLQLFEIVLLSFALADRYKHISLEKDRLEKIYWETLANANVELERKVGIRTSELEEAKEQAEIMARTDELTGMANRRSFYETGATLFSQARRYGHPITVIMLDIDKFKNINDTWGHAAGDDALRAIATVLKETCRDSDIFGRLGGEEFAIALLETTDIAAASFAERIRKQVMEITINTGGDEIKFTASFGVAMCDDGCANIDALISKADSALYEAKESGRNRVVTA